MLVGKTGLRGRLIPFHRLQASLVEADDSKVEFKVSINQPVRQEAGTIDAEQD